MSEIQTPSKSKAKENVSTSIYPGMRPFRPTDADYFFGRQSYIKEMKLKLSESKFLAVVGGAESGKSSLVKAGLNESSLEDFSVKRQDEWVIVSFVPRFKPISNLAMALTKRMKEIQKKEIKGDLSNDKDPIEDDIEDILNNKGSRGVIRAYNERLTNLYEKDKKTEFIDSD